MKNPRPPLFLARQNYRRRRMMDAARLLPILGIFLFLLPVLWRTAETPEPDTAWGGLYIFSVWLLLILAAFVLARVLSRSEKPGGAPDPAKNGAGPD